MPGFRAGKVPPNVIDQRVGRGTVLNEAVQEAIPENHRRGRARARGQDARPARGGDHRVRRRRAAEVHRRGRRAAGDHLPDLETIEVDGRRAPDRRQRGRRAARRAARAVRDAQDRRARRRDRRLSCRSTWPRPSTATRCRAAARPTSRTRSAATSCSRASTTTLVGMSAGDVDDLHHAARRRRLRRQDADVAVTVRTVKEKELPRARRRLRPAGQRVRHARRAAGRPARTGSRGSSGSSSSTPPATRSSRRWSRPPTCRRRRASCARRSSTASRPWPTSCERIGASMEDYLASEGKTEEQIDAELTDAASRGREDPAAAGHARRRRGDPGQRRRVRPRDRAPRPARRDGPAGLLRPAGPAAAAAAVYGDVRRGKALAR